MLLLLSLSLLLLLAHTLSYPFAFPPVKVLCLFLHQVQSLPISGTVVNLSKNSVFSLSSFPQGGSERSIEEIIAHHEKAPEEDNKKK